MFRRERVPLFFFSPEGEGGIGDGEEVEEEGFEIEVEEEVVVPEGDPPPEPAKPDPVLAAVLERNTQVLEGMTQNQQQMGQVTESIQGLTQQMGHQQYVNQQKMQGESTEEFNKRVNENFYKDPAGQLGEVLKQKDQENQNTYGPILLHQAKQLVAMGDGTKANYKRFQGEMDQEFAKVSSQNLLQNPGILGQIYEVVLGRHSSELATEQVTEGVKAALLALGLTVGEDGKAVPIADPAVEGGGDSKVRLSNKPPVTGVKKTNKVKITPKRMKELKTEAVKFGMEWEDYAHTLHENGEL